MVNEWKEYLDYTGTVSYTSTGKPDSTWRGRFSFEAFEDLHGFNRILAIIARRYLFHNADGSLLAGDPRSRLEQAHRAMCAWCSIPDDEEMDRQSWSHRTDFRELHKEFPDLVDAEGRGWFYQHYCAVMDFAANNEKLVRKTYAQKAPALMTEFPDRWRNKIVAAQYQTLSKNTDASWPLRFEDTLARALELGPLRNTDIELPLALKEKIRNALPASIPADNACMVYELIAYYVANKPEDSDWVVLPVTNFDYCFGDSNFSHTYLSRIPEEILVRSHKYDISRYRVMPEYLP